MGLTSVYHSVFIIDYSYLKNVKVIFGFNQEKALEGAFSVIVKSSRPSFEALMKELRSSETRMGITSTIISEANGELTT